MQLTTRTRRRAAFLAGFLCYFAGLWVLWPTAAIFPLKLFVVLLHEASHALAALATGGTVDRIVLTADEGGATLVSGGSPFIMLSAGYLGSLVWGLALIELAGARALFARFALGSLSAILLAVAAFLVRNLFGFLFTLLFGALLALAARWLPPSIQKIILTVLGMTSAMYALLDIRSDILTRPEVRSDAAMLAELTHVPTLVWGLLWSAIAITAVLFAVRRAWRRA